MKKLVLSALAVFSLTFVNAQEEEKFYGFEEGDVFIEGTIGFSASKDNNANVKANSFQFNPKGGYFLSDELAVGLEFGYLSSKQDQKIDNVYQTVDKSSAFEVGAFARYYFLELGKRFKTYGEFNLGFGSVKEGLAPAERKASFFGTGVSLGLNYFVTERIAISFGLSDILSYTSGKPEGGERVSEFKFGINEFNNFFDSNATFGLIYKL
ncbi:MAG: outer membrane beta-barrel protein [Bacteroidota bacterium]|nr:outer membrane beta-barrel protein [Bacteroidota bacterium]